MKFENQSKPLDMKYMKSSSYCACTENILFLQHFSKFDLFFKVQFKIWV
jgi:hypothetical protein